MNTQLREAREKAALTQVQIAKKAGISELAYQRYEAGKRTPNATTAILIAHAVNSTVEELFTPQE